RPTCAAPLFPVIIHLDLVRERRTEELPLSAEASEMVSIPRAELDALQAELRRLRREGARGVARARIQADPRPGGDAPALARGPLGEGWGIGEWPSRPLPGSGLAGDRSFTAAAAVGGSGYDLPPARRTGPDTRGPFPQRRPTAWRLRTAPAGRQRDDLYTVSVH